MKQLIKYQIYTAWYTMFIAFLVYFLIFILGVSMFLFSDGNSTGTNNGTEMTAIIICFILYVSNYGENMRFAIQNGRTRKAIFLSTLTSIAMTSVVLSIFSQVFNVVATFVYRNVSNGNYIYQSITKMLYNTESSTFSSFLSGFVYTTAILLVAGAAGMFLASGFARAGKLGRVAIAAGVPIFCFAILPIIIGFLSIKAPFFLYWIAQVLFVILGFESGNPYIGSFTFLIAALLLAFLSFLINRKLEIK